MTDDDGADTTEATGREGAELLGEGRGWCAGRGLFCWGDVLELLGDAGLEGRVGGVGGGHCVWMMKVKGGGEVRLYE